MIRTIEELSMNAWQAMQTILYDGWVLRFANGYTKRANSINPIYDSSEEISTKIEKCEQIYKSKGQRVVFKVTDAVYPQNLDHVLEERRYKRIDETSVQTLALTNVREPVLQTIDVFEEVNEKWLDAFCLLTNVSRESRNSLQNIIRGIVPDKLLVLLRKEEEIVGCGLCVMENGYMGLFDIVIAEQYRNQGLGANLVLNLLNLGKQKGAKKAYLQVVKSNYPALRLYEKIGFNEVYNYWYRVKE